MKIISSKVEIGSLTEEDKRQPFVSLAGAVDYIELKVKTEDEFEIAIDESLVSQGAAKLTVISDVALGNGFKCAHKKAMKTHTVFRYKKCK